MILNQQHLRFLTVFQPFLHDSDCVLSVMARGDLCGDCSALLCSLEIKVDNLYAHTHQSQIRPVWAQAHIKSYHQRTIGAYITANVYIQESKNEGC